MMKRKLGALVVLTLLMVLLTGCNLRSGDDLYALPTTSVEYKSLQQTLQTLLDGGLEYAPPLTGSNTQPVQNVDLDDDGIGEAIAFFRDPSAQESGLLVHVFRQDKDGEYQPMAVIRGGGTAVNSVAYPRMGTGDNRELVISWQISTGVYALSAYGLYEGGSEELMEPVNYTRYAVADLNDDGKDELFLLQLDHSDESPNRVECYSGADGALVKTGECSLSASLISIDRVKLSLLEDGLPALYITGGYAGGSGADSSAYQLTDVVMMDENGLKNLTRNDRSGVSVSTKRRTYVADQDLNGDGIWEVPVVNKAYERLEDGSICVSESFYLLSWLQFDSVGGTHVVCTTFYNTGDGWYLEIPAAWKQSMAFARRDTTEGATVERGIQIYAIEKDVEGERSVLRTNETTGQQVLTNAVAVPSIGIYKNTGTDRIRRSELGERVPIQTFTPDASYCTAIMTPEENRWTAEDVEKNLHIIVTKWSND